MIVHMVAKLRFPHGYRKAILPFFWKLNVKKVCIINPHFYHFVVGGAEVQLFLLSQQMISEGIEVHYVCADVDSTVEIKGVTLHPFKESANQLSKSMQRLTGIIDSINPDIVYQRGRKLTTYYAGKCCRARNIPFVFSVSMDIDCRYLKSAPRVFEQGTFSARNLMKFLIRAKEDFYSLKGMKLASRIITQTKRQQGALKKSRGLNSKTISSGHIVPTEESLVKTDPPVVLWLANLKEWKRPELFMQVANQLKHLDCQFIMAGRLATESYRSQIEETKAKTKIFDYLGAQTFEESNELISRASVFVNTSAGDEGFPNTFIQAWLREVPTITLDFDPDGIIAENQLGYHSGTLHQLAIDIEHLVKNSVERRTMGERARDFAVSRFSAEFNFGEVIETGRCLVQDGK